MKSPLSGLILLALSGAALSGCAGLRDSILGREIRLEHLAKANLGHTTRDEIAQLYGDPLEINKRWFESFESEVCFYQGEYNDPEGGGKSAYQTLALEFSKGVLTGWRLHDTATTARQDFADNDRAKLVKGVSSFRDVENVFGTPMLKALLPSTLTQPSLWLGLGWASFPLAAVPAESKEIWQYHHETLSPGGAKTAQRTLSVFFDAKGAYIGSALMQDLAIGH